MSGWSIIIYINRECIKKTSEIEDGYLKIPERPGLGSDLIEEELLKHQAKERYPYR